MTVGRTLLKATGEKGLRSYQRIIMQFEVYEFVFGRVVTADGIVTVGY